MFRPASQIAPRKIDWLWPGRLALGKLAVLEGDPGSAKSFLALDLCARLSSGRPAGDGAATPGPANAIFLSGEDGGEDTIRPRLDALDADLERVFVWDVDDCLLRLPCECDQLEEAVARVGAKLVVVDTLLAFLDPGVNVGSNQSIRRALAPLRGLAKKQHCCVLLLRHLVKEQLGRALYRGEGSIGIGGLCRSTWLAARHPRDARQHVLAQVKNNNGPPQPSLAYVLVDRPGAEPLLEWKGASPCTAEDLHARKYTSSRLARAGAFLTALLKEGPRSTKEIWDAADRHRLSKRTLQRARESFEISSQRVGPPGRQIIYWLLKGQTLPEYLKDPSDIDLSPWLKPLEEKYPKRNPLEDG